jgi:hypothetical protein
MIKVAYLLSYDYELFLTSVKQVYNYADKIVVGIDQEYKTWSGNSFEIPDSFFDEVKVFDKKNKIQFYFDVFYIPSLCPMECETRERNLVLKKLGSGWKIQLDVDEYIYDFSKVFNYLQKYWFLKLFPNYTPIVFKGKLVTLFRQLSDGFLYIENNERFPFITNQSSNTHTRNNNLIKNHFSNINVIHQSWARSEEEIQFKIKNWGHRDDFDTQKYFEFWKNLNSNNYLEFKNIHPLVPEVWNKLHFMKCSNSDEFIDNYASENPQNLLFIDKQKMFKALKNSILKQFLKYSP